MKMLSSCLPVIMSLVSFSVSGSALSWDGLTDIPNEIRVESSSTPSKCLEECSKPDATTVTLTKAEQQIVTSCAQKVKSDVRDKFEKLHEEWYDASRKDMKILISSSIYTRMELPQFKEMLDMGGEIIPLVVEKMMDRKYFFTQSLYEALMENAHLSVGEDGQVVRSSQDRAQFLARQWVSMYSDGR